jgi:hypothetical protein
LSDHTPQRYRFDGYGYMRALPNLVVDIVTVMSSYLTDASAQADAAAASAITAFNAPGTASTSSTSMAVGYGLRTFQIEPGKDLLNGMSLDMASRTAPTDVWMHGKIQSYVKATGATVVKVTALSSLGTVADDWNVFNAAPGGATLGYNQYTGSQFYAAGIFEGYLDIGAGSTVDLRLATFFKKTVTTAWTLVIDGVPAGAGASFTLKIVDGGKATMTLPAGTQFANGLAPLLTLSGVDRLHFVRDPGGNWEVYPVGSDVK